MRIQLLMVGLLAIASTSCAPGIATNATPSASTTTSPATAALTSATNPDNLSLKEELEGTWSAGFMTVTFNWDAGTYSGVMLDEPFSKTLEFVSETGNEIVFKADGSLMVGRFDPNGEVRLTESADSSSTLRLKRI
ncbi:hypothetical protein H6G00_16050 [Leptolyngbya sp. FACHB-541]|uniref:hypothetical protein n=1 Tax=Leptolyngbya sp. FACHB-541 TaxID=2692810 RepID=UPI0016863359|nr:hypothetical protein [Leptolyngbya sp. FACHB-541]MBD1998119.1 hypothetical protein [Leptolyngbya sp. FACHB-541]